MLLFPFLYIWPLWILGGFLAFGLFLLRDFGVENTYLNSLLFKSSISIFFSYWTFLLVLLVSIMNLLSTHSDWHTLALWFRPFLP